MIIENIQTFSSSVEENQKNIKKVIDFIQRDGFDISDFHLVSITNDTWEFAKASEPARGFLIFYDPKVVVTPEPEYALCNGCISHTFKARNITEAYILHNKYISDEDYDLLRQKYSKTEQEIGSAVIGFAIKYGTKAASDAFNVTESWIGRQSSGSSPRNNA